MKVADERILHFDRGRHGRSFEPDFMRETDHDARGLLISVALCLAVWAALAYFLLG